MEVVINQQPPPLPTYDLVDLSRYQMVVIKSALINFGLCPEVLHEVSQALED